MAFLLIGSLGLKDESSSVPLMKSATLATLTKPIYFHKSGKIIPECTIGYKNYLDCIKIASTNAATSNTGKNAQPFR